MKKRSGRASGGRADAAKAEEDGREAGSERSHWRISTVLLLLLFILLYVMWAGVPGGGKWPLGGGVPGKIGGGVGGEPGIMVLIDAGHGGKDGGTVGHGMLEKSEVLKMAKELGEELARLGITSELTRQDDRYIELEERWMQANRGGYELFVSLHLNGSKDSSVHGVETFYSQPKSTEAESLGKRRYGVVGLASERSKALAEKVQESLVLETGARDRGAKNSRLAVVYRSACPAILVEAGFLTHPQEAAELAKSSYRTAIVRAIALGIEEWLREKDLGQEAEGQVIGEQDGATCPAS